MMSILIGDLVYEILRTFKVEVKIGPVTREVLVSNLIWLATVRNVRTAIMTSSEDIFIPELGFR